jgi:hypothetical protein
VTGHGDSHASVTLGHACVTLSVTLSLTLFSRSRGSFAGRVSSFLCWTASEGDQHVRGERGRHRIDVASHNGRAHLRCCRQDVLARHDRSDPLGLAGAWPSSAICWRQ